MQLRAAKLVPPSMNRPPPATLAALFTNTLCRSSIEWFLRYMPPPYGASFPSTTLREKWGFVDEHQTPPPSSPAVFPAMRLPETMGGKPAENIIITPPPDWLVRFPMITLSSRSMEPLKAKMPPPWSLKASLPSIRLPVTEPVMLLT